MSLKEAVEEYDLQSTRGISPISGIDSKIVKCIKKILVQVEANPKFIEVVANWKSAADEDTLSLLEEISLEAESDVDSVIKSTVDFIEIGSYILSVKSLFSVESVDTYDSKRNSLLYKVVINQSDNPNIVNCNREVSFTDEEKRDMVVDRLQERLSQFTNIRFL